MAYNTTGNYYPDKRRSVTNPNDYIVFADPLVEQILMENGVGDGSGITYNQAAAVTSIPKSYFYNTNITSFDEFQFFTGVTTIQREQFKNCQLLESIVFPSSLTGIIGRSFEGCNSLKYIFIPSGVKKICNGTFPSNVLDGCIIYEDGTDGVYFTDYWGQYSYAYDGIIGNSKFLYYGRGELTGPYEPYYGPYRPQTKAEKILIGENAVWNILDVIRGECSVTFLPERSNIYPKPLSTKNAGIETNLIKAYFVKKSLLNDYKNNAKWLSVKSFIYPYGPAIAPNSTTEFILESGTTYNLPIKIYTPFFEDKAYYTTDGTTPTSASTEYTEAYSVVFDIHNPQKTVKATSYQENEWVYDEKTYTLKLPTPILTTSSGDAYDTLEVIITSPHPDANIYYTTDGTTPTIASTLYRGPIIFNEPGSVTVKAIAKYANTYSDVATENYTINLSAPVITTPEWHLIDESDYITIACVNSGATIYYTTDGSTPTSASTLYTEPFKIRTIGETYVKAVAFRNNLYSDVTSQLISLGLSGVIITPSGGTYLEESPSITLSHNRDDVFIYYKLSGDGDWGDPSSADTRSILYTGEPIKIYRPGTPRLKAVAYDGNKPEGNHRQTGSSLGLFYIKPTPPIVMPPSGAYASAITITMTNPKPEEDRHLLYNDGTDQYFYEYTEPITISDDGYYRYEAHIRWLGAHSEYVTNEYIIAHSAPNIPTISPSAGTWNYESSNITITDFISGTTVYYTTDGSTPTSGSTQYNSPFKLSGNGEVVLKVVALNPVGYSPVTTLRYNVIVPSPQATPSGGTYEESVTVSLTNPAPNSNATIYYTINDTSNYNVYSEPLTFGNIGTYTLYSYITYKGTSSNIVSEVYTVTDKKPKNPVITPESGTYNDDLTIQITTYESYPVYYTTDGSTPTSASTLYTEPFVVEGDGIHAVKAVAFNNTVYSSIVTNNYTIVYPKPEAPVLSPSAATFAIEDDHLVEMSASDNGSEIYYTTDGTAPTKDSARYTNPLYISSDCVISAVTYNENFKGKYSSITTGTYTVQQTQKSAKARRVSDDSNGIYIKNITYSGSPAESRAITLPTVKVTDNEADVTWGYHADNVDEDYGQYGTKCKVSDTSITIHLEFTHDGKKHILEKEIPCTCIEQDAIDKPFLLDIVKGEGTVTLENHLETHVRARVKHVTEDTVSVLTDLTDYTLKGESEMGTFTCTKDGGYFVYDGTLSLNYSGSTNQAREIILTLTDSDGNEIDTYNIPVTFAPGSIFEVRDDAIRMAVQGSKTYTDGQVSGVTNHISQLELTMSSITSTVEEIDGDAMRWTEIDQVSSAITLNVFNELNESTGLRIEDGQITLNADNTEILGNLNVRDGENGLTVFDQAGNPRINLRNTPVPAYGPDMFITEGSFASNSPKTTGTAGNSITCTGELDPIGTVGNGDTISLTGMWITADTFSGNTLTHPKLSVAYKIYAGASSSSGTVVKQGTGTTAYQSWRTGNFFTINDFSFISSMSGTMHLWIEATFTLPAGTNGGIATLNGYATSKPVALTMIGNNGFYSFSDDNNHFYTSSGGTYLHTEYDYNQSYKRVGAIALRDGHLLRYGPNDGIRNTDESYGAAGYVALDGMYSYTSLSELHYITGQSPYTMTSYPANVAHTTSSVPVYYAKDTDSVIEVDYLDVEADVVYVDVKNLTKFNGRKIRVLKSIDVTVWLIDSETTSASGSVKAKSAIVGLNDAPPTSSQILNGVEFPGNGDQINWDGAEIMRYDNNNAWKVIS